MKVAYLLGSLNRGGAETLVLDELRNAKRASFEMLLIHRKNGVLADAFAQAGVPMRKCPFKAGRIVSFIVKLRLILRREHVDVVHTQQRLDAMLAHFATIGTEIKVVDTFHGFDTGYGWRERLFVKLSRNWSDALVFVSQFEANHYISRYAIPKEKTHVVYNGIDFSKFDNVNEVPELPRHNPDSVRMSMVGNFGSGRDHLTVCRFLKLLHEKGICFDFYFVGRKNSDTPALFEKCVDFCLENGLSDCVHFLGQRGDVPAVLRQMDAFVYSTVHDTFGIAVVEAMAAGLPVFVNDWAVMKELAENGKLATLYESRNEIDLLDKIMVFVRDKEVYQARAKMCKNIVREKYSIQKNLSDLASIYEKLL